MEQKHGTTIPALSMDVVNNLNIPIPPLSLQNKIVAILDIFSSSATTEINLRQKQYEYYQNKLLSFNKVS
ncbi:restriction endonuclease subunit S [Mycoplasmopsis bovirhinis]|uniref:restriction endonuclease subunit S n=1 Tax=Mycoplasmopsis bovirhinis TaxID=29553 RepID=UPI000E747E6B|nr:restriction endonuclease subunit S [Mycoplasmopsis bovirhinis]